MPEILALLESLRAQLSASSSLTEGALARRAGVSETSPEFQAAMRLLNDRMEILVDEATRTVRCRRRLAEGVVEALAGGPSTMARLRARLDGGAAGLAEVVGWLVREGRVEIEEIGGAPTVRLKRGSSGPHAVETA